MKYNQLTLGQVEAVFSKLGGEERVQQFLSGQLVVVSPDQVFKPSILKIDRTNPFDPAKFIGKGWSIWCGPKEGKGLEGEEEQDARSLVFTEIDPTKLIIETGLDGDETVITGEGKLVRLILKAIQADAKIAETLYKEEGQITLRWMYRALGLKWIEFLGTVLRHSSGDRYTLYLCRVGDGSWDWVCLWLDTDRNAGNPALALTE